MSQPMFQWGQVSIVTIQPDKKMGYIKRILIRDGVVADTDIQYLTRFLQFLHKYRGYFFNPLNAKVKPHLPSAGIVRSSPYSPR